MSALVLAALATPSPRRGEGGVRGLGSRNWFSDSVPPHPVLLPHSASKTRVNALMGEKGPSLRAAISLPGTAADGASFLVLATHPRPSFAKPFPTSASKNKGRRSAGRRNCPVDPRHTRRRCRLQALRARPRVQRDALASRRSTAALAKALTPRLNLGPRFLEPPGANGRTLPGASAASSSRTGRSAGRAGPRGRPGTDRILPPAGTALAPLSGVPS
jgi:hypothetical protein